MDTGQPSFQVSDSGGRPVFAILGDWTIWTASALDEALRRVRFSAAPLIDVSGLRRIDTSGAFLVDRTARAACGAAAYEVRGDHPSALRLLTEVRRVGLRPPVSRPHAAGFIALLDRLGHGFVHAIQEFLGILSFIGELSATLGRLALNPRRIRWTSVFAVIEEAGLDALPIVSFLSFFIGLVIAFLGANLLAQFGAALFTVELVSFAMLREFGVVLTGILLAGRTDSAFTAQIGSMRMRQEIDAMRVLGLDPMEVLVAPRLIALVVMTPLLSFIATLAGILGGLLAAWLAMDISPTMFIGRFLDTVQPKHFWTGIVKAPVMASVVAIVGCRHGLLVEGDVQSLGKRVTTAVVQAIFLVILIDAMFAIIYYEMGL